MSETDKLRVLLPHWIEHNNSHIAEFTKWKQVAADCGKDLAEGIEEAIDAMKKAGASLQGVLEKLGGPAESHHHHHHH
ncbi:MAG: hypothetical protein KKG47_03635 [Proteobacteria bacterium]|nr:hypothetical protein [Pseudomonadota bacterium]MBU1739310.1 hypothetical protein [Pseudomonadota bacterium]